MLLKSALLAGTIAGALLLPAAASAASGEAARDANIRSGPGTNYRVIATVPRGAPIEILGCQGWCQVQYGNVQGYMAGSLVVASSSPNTYYSQTYVQPYAYAQAPYDYNYYDYYDGPFYDEPFYFGFGGGGYRHHGGGHWGHGGGNWGGGSGGHMWFPRGRH